MFWSCKDSSGRILTLNVYLLALTATRTIAFQPNTVNRLNSSPPLNPRRCGSSALVHHPWDAKTLPLTATLRMNKGSDDNEDEDDDDDYIDDADLGDWRSFRKTLVDSNFSDKESDKITDGFMGSIDISDIDEVSSSSEDAAANNAKEKRPKSIIKDNEELLKEQSTSLAKEYVEGMSAHVSSFVSTYRTIAVSVLVFN
eukprot:scaffold1133_cov294-Chaetoceros_neogracile.AAC.14